MTYLYDKQRALDTLATLQPTWGGDIATRMARDKAKWQATQAANAAQAAPPADQGDTSVQANAATPPATSAATAAAPPSEQENGQDHHTAGTIEE